MKRPLTFAPLLLTCLALTGCVEHCKAIAWQSATTTLPAADATSQAAAPRTSPASRPSVNASQPQEIYLYPAPLGQNADTMWGYIDRQGQVAIPPAFSVGYGFSEGIAPVQVGRPFAFIDRQGRFLSDLRFHYGAVGFREGMAVIGQRGWLHLPPAIEWGYANRKGEVAIGYRFAKADDFHEGLAAVRSFGSDKWGYINKEGDYVIQPRFEEVGYFSEGLASAKSDGKWGCIDRTGQFVIQPQYRWVYPFSEGLAWVYGEGVNGFIDRTGRLVVSLPPGTGPSSTEGGIFSEGVIPVQVKRIWGYMDKAGHFTVQPAFHDARNFSEGLAIVMVGGEWSGDGDSGFWHHGQYGYIDKTGRIVIAPQFTRATPFRGGRAEVQKMGPDAKSWTEGWMLIDADGRVVWKQKEAVTSRGTTPARG